MLYYMNTIIKKEFIEFEKYHRNIYNIYFHIICGFIFMTFLFLLSNNYSNLLLILYTLFILFTFHNLFITFIIFIILFVMAHFVKKYKFSFLNKLIIFIIFYFLSSLSHFLTGEKTVLNINNLTLYSIIINTLYFIPFSMYCLYKKIYE
jgi:hypothetical protein